MPREQISQRFIHIIMIKFKSLIVSLLVLLLFVSIGFSVYSLTDSGNHIRIIFEYSVMGFVTFFMGYFGLVFAQKTVKMLGSRESKMVQGACYYFRKKNKYRF